MLANPAEPVRVIGYVRVSMMREEAISPQTQMAAIESWASRNGRKIIDWVEDLDKTGRNFKRKVTGAIDRVRAGEAEEIAVWKFSRFGRSRTKNAEYLALLEDAGGRLVSATEEVDIGTATGKFTRGMLLEMAAFESDRAGEIWAEVYGHRVRDGLPPFGRPRFGYTRAGRIADEDRPGRTRHIGKEAERYIPDPLTGPVLAGMYRAWIAGEEGSTAIARRLNAEGYRTSYGNPWRSQAVIDVLDSGFGAGLLWLHDSSCQCRKATRCRNRRYVRGTHEPVIGRPEWEAYIARRSGMKEGGSRSRVARFPVSGLVRCGHCRSAVVGSGYGQDGAMLFSCSRQRHYGDCPGKPSLPVTLLVLAAREAVGEWAADIDEQARAELSRQAEGRAAGDAVTRLEGLLEGAERKLVRLALARAGDDVLPEESWRAAAADARAERDQVAADLAKAKGRARAAARSLMPVLHGILQDWDRMPPSALNQVLRQLIRRIEVHRTGERTRNPAGHWNLMPVRIEVVPAWLPDPWEATII